MNVPVLVFAAATLAAPQMDDPRAPAATPAVAPIASVQQQVEPRSRRTGDRPHTVGVGGQMTISNRGAGGGTRLFFGERLGVNLNAFWVRNGRYTSSTSQGSTFAMLPSFIFMLTKPDSTRDVDIRPYVGGGVSYVRSSRPTASSSGSTTLQRRSGTGSQVFGGVEMTFREFDRMTISAEGIYYNLPVSFVNSSVVGGFNYLLAFHFYLR